MFHSVTTNDILKEAWKIKYQKKRVIVKRTVKQMVATKMKCACVFRKFYVWAFILDEETHFTLIHSTINNHCSYYTTEISTKQGIIKLAFKLKFEGKILNWSITIQWLWWIFKLWVVHNEKSTLYVEQQIHIVDKCIRRLIIHYVHSNYNDGDNSSAQTWPAIITARSFIFVSKTLFS